MENNHMQGKTVLISGATRGIGKEAALALARMGARVRISGRSPERVASAVAEIQEKSQNPNVIGYTSDLSNLAGVEQLASAFRREHDRLDVLVNNAGALFMNRNTSAEGFEMTWALNHLSYFRLTALLLDLLLSSAPARIVNVSSMAHAMTGMRFDDLQFNRRYFGWTVYSHSKLANVLFTYELARKLEGSGVTANALHPGFVATNFGRSNGGFFDPIFRLSHLAAMTPEKGAQTTIYLASSPEVEGVSGKYFSNQRAVPSSPASYNLESARCLWDVTQDMAKVKMPIPVAVRVAS